MINGMKRIAAMCILQHKDRFLLLKRAKMPNKGMYVPVGGKLDPFERPHDAARRETWEETGLEIDPGNCCGVLTESSPTDYNWMCYIYKATIGDIPPPPCPEGDLEWIFFDELLTIPTPPTDWWIYQYVMKGKPFIFDAVYDEQLNMLELREEIEGIIMPKQPG